MVASATDSDIVETKKVDQRHRENSHKNNSIEKNNNRKIKPDLKIALEASTSRQNSERRHTHEWEAAHWTRRQ